MNRQLSGYNKNIESIVNGYLNKGKIDNFEEKIYRLLGNLFKENGVIPYSDISDIILNKNEELISYDIIVDRRNEVNSFIQGKGKEEIKEEEIKKEKELIHLNNKIAEHIQLALVQRNYIQKIIKRAEETAKQAEETAKQAEETATKAEETATKAEETYKSMFANYVTILGIFTAIIVTIFGGLNVIDTALGNISENNSKILYVVSLIMFCEIVLLYFLATIISWITKKEEHIDLNLILLIVTGIFLLIIVKTFS